MQASLIEKTLYKAAIKAVALYLGIDEYAEPSSFHVPQIKWDFKGEKDWVTKDGSMIWGLFNFPHKGKGRGKTGTIWMPSHRPNKREWEEKLCGLPVAGESAMSNKVLWHEFCHAAEYYLTGNCASKDSYPYWDEKCEKLARTVPIPRWLITSRWIRKVWQHYEGKRSELEGGESV